MDSDMTEAFSFGSDIVPSRAEQTAPLMSRLWGRDDRIPREEAVSFLAEVRSEATADAAADDALFFKGGRGGANGGGGGEGQYRPPDNGGGSLPETRDCQTPASEGRRDGRSEWPP